MKFAKKILYQLVSTVLLAAILASSAPFAEQILPGSALCHAERDPLEEMEQRKTLPIQSNEIADWPKGSVDGESTISSARSILRIDPGRTVTGPPFSDAAMPAIIPNRKIQKNSERNEPTKKASTPAKNVLKKFMERKQR